MVNGVPAAIEMRVCAASEFCDSPVPLLCSIPLLSQGLAVSPNPMITFVPGPVMLHHAVPRASAYPEWVGVKVMLVRAVSVLATDTELKVAIRGLGSPTGFRKYPTMSPTAWTFAASERSEMSVPVPQM
jgi:hypothetical protein